jgi:hypothetical protein
MRYLKKYFISNFSIAKTIDNLHTLVKINSYMLLELWQGGD